MAGNGKWIASYQDLKDHPKVHDLMRFMGWGLDETLGKLHRFWWWVQSYAEDGDLRKHNDERLGAIVGLNDQDSKKFVEAMVKSCWIDREPYFRVHDWWDHIGLFLRRKYGDKRDKWRRVQHLYSPGTSAIQLLAPHNKTQHNKTQPKAKSVKFAKPTGPEVSEYAQSIGFSLDGEVFVSYYESKGWVVGRAAMKNWKAAVRTWKNNGGGGGYGRRNTVAGEAAPEAGKYRGLQGES